MELNQVKDVRFIRDPHSYVMADGKELMGVTTLLRKHGLATDYSFVDEDTLERAAQRGTAIHELIEDYENGMPVMKCDTLNAYVKLGLSVVASEYLVTDWTLLASKIDQVYQGEDDTSVDLGDIKTCASIDREYLSWQLSIYAYLFERQNLCLRVNNLYCIHLREGKAKKIAIRRKPDEEIERLIECEYNGCIFYPSEEEPAQSSELALFTQIREKFTALELAKKSMKTLEDELKVCYGKVYEFMEREGLQEIPVNGGRIVRSADYERTTVDSKMLKELYPDIAAQCEKKTLVKGSVSFKPEK